MVEGKLHEIVRSFLRQLKDSGTEAGRAIVYGQAASTPDWPGQEIDLLVISDAFGEDCLADGRLLLQAAWETDPRIVPIAVRSEAWDDAGDDPRLFWARENGIAIVLDEVVTPA